MLVSEYSQYCGRLKQPLQKPDVDKPSMYFVSDWLKKDFNLILLTPGTYWHAYKFIEFMNPTSLKLFIPSLRPEFISDIYNLYILLKDRMPVNWVFPLEIFHYDFEKGQIRDTKYVNEADPRLSISYLKNPNLNDVFDIIVRTRNASNYFSYYLTEERLIQLYKTKDCTLIHLPKSSTLYGGLSYDQAVKLNCKYRKKLEPYDFSSIEELYNFKRRAIPEADTLMKYEDDPDNESFPEDYTGDVTEIDIQKLLDDDVTEGSVDHDPV